MMNLELFQKCHSCGKKFLEREYRWCPMCGEAVDSKTALADEIAWLREKHEKAVAFMANLANNLAEKRSDIAVIIEYFLDKEVDTSADWIAKRFIKATIGKDEPLSPTIELLYDTLKTEFEYRYPEAEDNDWKTPDNHEYTD